MQEWICESHFGWGQLRSVPSDTTLPGPVAISEGPRSISVHFGDDGQMPLWENGSPADPASFVLTESLRADIAAWQARGEALAEEAQAAVPVIGPERTGVFGSKIEYVNEESEQIRRSRIDQRRRRVLDEWHAWVGELQPWRDRLVSQLREELGPEFQVVTPPRFPTLD